METILALTTAFLIFLIIGLTICWEENYFDRNRFFFLPFRIYNYVANWWPPHKYRMFKRQNIISFERNKDYLS